MRNKDITIIKGDGIGPEVIDATLRIMDAVKTPLNWDIQVAGKEAFKQGIETGVPKNTITSIEKNKIVLKGPLETPVGHGESSANVTLRKLFETYANLRPAHHIPSIQTPFSDRDIDLIVVRENLEDLYAGIEHQQTPDVAQSLKLMSRTGCERICRFAFEYARALDRKKIHCTTKANIMKLTEGLLKKVFEEISSDYPNIQAEHIIVDNCAHQLVINPEQFDMIIASNMNGDILSDLTSGLVGGLGIAASANIGDDYAIFEAVHGSAPTIAGQNKANPTALISASILMLRHLELYRHASQIEAALYKTLEDQNLTIDLAKDPKMAVSCSDFTDYVIRNISDNITDTHHYKPLTLPPSPIATKTPTHTPPTGIDVFIQSSEPLSTIVEKIQTCIDTNKDTLLTICNRGAQVYPETRPLKTLVDHWQCKFKTDDTLGLLQRITPHFNWVHCEKLWQ
ncbi:NADP-dependent isocitrate dehydrogenase [Candidatus Marinamargulisbacteria bacterium SCGC AG-439-L15]|nr:NADP-dependent isocitrate dehydrogenase [Candidatus Marinamargulisbacteria bacterium SCGC AG-439-L15]